MLLSERARYIGLPGNHHSTTLINVHADVTDLVLTRIDSLVCSSYRTKQRRTIWMYMYVVDPMALHLVSLSTLLPANKQVSRAHWFIMGMNLFPVYVYYYSHSE